MKPTFDNVFIGESKKENVTAGGIIIQGNDGTGAKPGLVIAVGPDCKFVKEGDKVHVKWSEGMYVSDDDATPGILISEENVKAVL